MAKKDFASDLQNFIKKGEKELGTGGIIPPVEPPKKEDQQKTDVPRGVGRPREHEPYEKTTVTFPPELMGKLKVMCLYEGKQIREILEDALGRLIDEYEQKHGAIRVPPRFRGK